MREYFTYRNEIWLEQMTRGQAVGALNIQNSVQYSVVEQSVYSTVP